MMLALTRTFFKSEDQEPPAKKTKFFIIVKREEDKYHHATVIKCWRCDPEKGSEIPDAAANPKVRGINQIAVHLFN